MNKKSELNKCKNDIVYFTEKYLGIELMQWQKILLRNYYK